MSSGKVTKSEFDYFLSKINFGASFLDAKAIATMNKLVTLLPVATPDAEAIHETSMVTLEKAIANGDPCNVCGTFCDSFVSHQCEANSYCNFRLAPMFRDRAK